MCQESIWDSRVYTCPENTFLEGYMDETRYEVYFGLKHEMESSPVPKQINQQTI